MSNLNKIHHFNSLFNNLDVNFESSLLLQRIESLSVNQSDPISYSHKSHCKHDRNGGGHGSVCWPESEFNNDEGLLNLDIDNS